MDGNTLWGFVREYVQAEATWRTCEHAYGPEATETKKAAEQVTRMETAAREAFQKQFAPANRKPEYTGFGECAKCGRHLTAGHVCP